MALAKVDRNCQNRYPKGMGLTSLNVSLPNSLKDYLAVRVSAGGYSTPSEYVRALIREDQKRTAEERLETLLVEGLSSGEPIEVTSKYWKQKRQRLAEARRRRTSR